jgi:hypothetical protein
MLLIASLALAGASVAAPTQNPAAPQAGDEIVVQGSRPSKHPVRDFVKALTDVPLMGQIGRFHAAVCPAAMGLTSAQNQQIAARVRRVAAAAEMRVAPEKCTPNAFVIVAPDKGAAITELNRKYPAYFTGMSGRQIAKLADTPEPAAAWQVKSIVTADEQAAKKVQGADYYVVHGAISPSRIKAASAPTFVASVVVIDLKSALGLSVVQLADYAALRLFADVDPARVVKSGAPSVLGVLGAPADRPAPASLTYWDLGFLKGLYSTSNAYYAAYQRGDLEHMLRKELEGAGRSPRQ